MINTTVEQMENDVANIEKNKATIQETLEKLKSSVDMIDENSWAGAASATFKEKFTEFYNKIIKCVEASEVFKDALNKAATAYKDQEAAINAGAGQI